MAQYELMVNGNLRQVEADADVPLLWVLRDDMNLTGTKFGRGMGLCRACTILIDGAASFSCMLPVSSAVGKSITTIEGLAPEGDLTPVQQAWVEMDVPQCGYCQTGQIMTATHLLSQHPQPTDAQIDAYMSPVICRCGTYPRVKQAIKRASQLFYEV